MKGTRWLTLLFACLSTVVVRIFSALTAFCKKTEKSRLSGDHVGFVLENVANCSDHVKFKVKAQFFCKSLKQEVLILSTSKGRTIQSSVSTISNNPAMIDALSPKDAFLVGFLNGSEVNYRKSMRA